VGIAAGPDVVELDIAGIFDLGVGRIDL